MPEIRGILQADPLTYTAMLGSESVTVVFDSAKMTGRWAQRISQAQEAEDLDKLVEAIVHLFISWDVTDENRVPVPMTPALLLDLPAAALKNLLRGMREAAEISDAEGNASSTSAASPPSSASTPESESSPNGSATGTSPTPSESLSSS